jgi:hypothetical protein
MKWDTKVLICGCGAMAIFCLFLRDYRAFSGFVSALMGWLVVGFKEQREVK